jgi:hypothetical protein
MERAFYHLGSELTIEESMELSVTMVPSDGKPPELSGSDVTAPNQDKSKQGTKEK